MLITGTAHDNPIGGVGAVQGSVIRQNTFSGNASYGLAIVDHAHDNWIFNSYVGTEAGATAAPGQPAGRHSDRRFGQS